MMKRMIDDKKFECNFSFLLSGLKELPSLAPGSRLKKLDAYGCDIQSLPADLFHFCLEEVNLNDNKGESREDA